MEQGAGQHYPARNGNCLQITKKEIDKMKKYSITKAKFEATFILINNKYYNISLTKKCEECGEYHITDDMTDVGGRYEV